jgi:predicted NACHT family NTPase
VRLGEFNVKGKKVTNEDVWEYVKKSAPRIRDRIDNLRRDGRLVILFDGMDEMSRKDYSENVKALNKFAKLEKQAKMLFSCRIIDFSPEFSVNQLVVLQPFDRKQVAEYLDKYIGAEYFPIITSGRHWEDSKELAKHIVEKEKLPIEGNNPFILSLLFQYLRDEESWPNSRIELMKFYNEKNYGDKKEKRSENEPSFPDMEDAFHEWARFAYVISKSSSDIAIDVLLKGEHDAAMERMSCNYYQGW